MPTSNGRHDVITHRIIVGGLVAVVMLAGVGMIVLPALNRTIPASLSHVGAFALGALSNALAVVMKGNGHHK